MLSYRLSKRENFPPFSAKHEGLCTYILETPDFSHPGRGEIGGYHFRGINAKVGK
jgi:hypothetical protein